MTISALGRKNRIYKEPNLDWHIWVIWCFAKKKKITFFSDLIMDAQFIRSPLISSRITSIPSNRFSSYEYRQTLYKLREYCQKLYLNFLILVNLPTNYYGICVYMVGRELIIQHGLNNPLHSNVHTQFEVNIMQSCSTY